MSKRRDCISSDRRLRGVFIFNFDSKIKIDQQISTNRLKLPADGQDFFNLQSLYISTSLSAVPSNDLM